MKKALIVIGLLSLTACGGGGSGSSNSGGGSNNNSSTPVVVTPKTFSLQKINSTTLGTVYTAQLSGSDSDGNKYTGTVSMANRAEQVLNGVMVTPRDLLLSITPVGGSTPSITSLGTSYVETATGNLIGLFVQSTTNVTCVSLSPYHMPASVKVGDFETSATLSCNDGTTQEGVWRAEDAGSGNVRVTLSATTKKSSVVINTSDTSYTIDSAGTILSVKQVIALSASGFTLTLTSK